jgi:hypothetical protein
MLTLIREGGFPIYAVLLFGLLDLLMAGVFAARGDRRCVGTIVALGVATALSILGAVASDIAAVGHHALSVCDPRAGLPACLLTGLAESMSPAIVGFTLLSLVAMLTALGLSRSARLPG